MTTQAAFTDIEDQIRTFLAQHLLFTGDRFDYADDASFLKEGIIDSLGVMDLVTFVHSQYGVLADTNDITPDNFDSVAKLAAFIRRKQGDAKPAA